MKITYLGTGAAEGVPAMFCTCPFCNGLRKQGALSEFRTRSQTLIDGDLSVDFPPEAYVHSLAHGVNLSALKYVLVTHSHMDHFYAHDFILRGYKYAETDGGKMNIFGNAEVCGVFSECTRREMRNEVLNNIVLTELHAFEKLNAGAYRVLTLPAMHGTAEEALLYYVEKGGKGYLHLCDTGALSDGAVEFLAQNKAHANAVTFDCTFLDAPPKECARHMCVEDNMEIINRLNAAGVADRQTKCVITHFSHNARPYRERVESVAQKYGVIAAYDGFTLEV
ncbi:MAG: MBL fold metallo-hydrolase [Roseburia sp.]|nr:MBL fold metallo-hydrolase [Roseburia sp.]